MVHDHASLSFSDVYGCFVFDFVIFSIINDYGGVGVVLNELKVSPSWP